MHFWRINMIIRKQLEPYNKTYDASDLHSRITTLQLKLIQAPKWFSNSYQGLSFLREVLGVIKAKHEPLYLCCLLMYGCLLRPHQELRLLNRGSFNEAFDVIILGGNQNKSRRIRSVHIPQYVRDELINQRVDGLTDEKNIFSRSSSPFNMSYFNTAWSRIKEDLVERGVISQNHTLYSFRHSCCEYVP